MSIKILEAGADGLKGSATSLLMRQQGNRAMPSARPGMTMRTLGSDRDGRLILVTVAVSDAAMDAIY
ncbi:hypothetical protein B2G71_11740 [Novosphingobium sp. PC22D]|nr:hypothetical protein B2G71_11740 [Novosphingobium sp. PC22D]